MQYFLYRNQHIKELNEREKKYKDKKAVDEELKILKSLGITKKHEAKTLYGVFGKKSNKKNKINDMNTVEKYWMKKEEEKQNEIKIEKENSLRDADYVKYLDNWEKKHLPKIDNK